MGSQITRPQQAAGFSLVELMLALALGLVVVTGIVQLFVGNSRTYNVLNGQARMQENARFALEFISQAARSAGFFGCTTDRANFVNGLGGDWASIPAGQFDISQIIDAEADRITFRSMRRPGQRLVEVLQPDENPIVTAPGGDPGFGAGDVVVLANCEQGAVFRVENVLPAGDEAEIVHRPPPPGGTCSGSNYVADRNASCVRGLDGFSPYTLSILNRSYGPDTIIGGLDSTAFYVAPGADEHDALWQDVNGDASELVPGVDAMWVLFGIDTDPSDGVRQAGRYVPFADLPDPDDLTPVVTLRVFVTVSSAVSADEGRLQRTFSKTILLRNSRPEA